MVTVQTTQLNNERTAVGILGRQLVAAVTLVKALEADGAPRRWRRTTAEPRSAAISKRRWHPAAPTSKVHRGCKDDSSKICRRA